MVLFGNHLHTVKERYIPVTNTTVVESVTENYIHTIYKNILFPKLLLIILFTLVFFIQVNEVNVNLPVTLVPSVSVFKSGKHYTVSLNFGVTVRYDGNHFMDIKVIKE